MEEKVQPWQRLTDYVTLSVRVRQGSASSGKTTHGDMQQWGAYTGGALTSRLAYFAEYTGYDRAIRTGRSDGFQDAYLQYADAPTASRFRWARVGRVYPFAVYDARAGGRVALSRPRILSERMGGFLPELQRRSFGISGGLSQRGTGGPNIEMALLSTGDSFASRADTYLTLEQNFDPNGSGVTLLRRDGFQPGRDSSDRYSQNGIFGRFAREAFFFSGAFLVGEGKDSARRLRQPTGGFLEAARNIRTETTAFLRYDSVQSVSGSAGPRTEGLALGISQRIPNRGRAVIEFSDNFRGSSQRGSVLLDILLMY